MKLGEIVDTLEINPRKLTEYALNMDNPKGRDKAIMFRQHLGYFKDNYKLLLEQILYKSYTSEAIFLSEDEHGKRYQVDLEITGTEPEQKEIVRTGWIVEPESDTARLVTLYVRKKYDKT